MACWQEVDQDPKQVDKIPPRLLAVQLSHDEIREYRVCPQCGSNMYRQGRTWTCSNCGYSYVE